MLAVFGLSMGIDRAFFPDVAIGTSSAGKVIALLAVHTVWLLAYSALALLSLRPKPSASHF